MAKDHPRLKPAFHSLWCAVLFHLGAFLGGAAGKARPRRNFPGIKLPPGLPSGPRVLHNQPAFFTLKLILAHVPARRFHLSGARFEFMRANSKPPGGFKFSPDIVESHDYKRGFRKPRSFAYEQRVKCPG